MSDVTFLPEGTWLASRQYRIKRFIGAGGCGKTYLVETQFGDLKVVKELFLDTMCGRDDSNTVTVNIDNDKNAFKIQCEKFKEEARRINQLSHPNIVNVSAIFEENDTVYYVMDYVDGMSLKERYQAGPIAESEILYYLKQLLSALEYIHSEGISHLDVKPGNIMLDKSGRLVLIDFGSCKMQTSSSDNKSMMNTYKPSFTPGYAPIEQENGNVDDMGPHCDIYAVGATLYYLYTGENPASPFEISRRGLPVIKGASSHMQYVIRKAMAYWVGDRIKSVEEFRNILNSDAKTILFDDSKDVTSNYGGPTVSLGGGNARNMAPLSQPTPPKINRYNISSQNVAPKARINRMPMGVWKKVIIIILALVAAFALGMSGYSLYEKFNDTPTSSEDTPTYTIDDQDDTSDNNIGKKSYLIENVNGVKFKMIKVEGGSFDMGAQPGQAAQSDEYPAHKVTLNDYYIGETEVTQGLWEAVMGIGIDEYRYAAESDFGWSCDFHGYGADYPMYYVSWDDCNEFISRLNKITGKTYSLPTEAQWEFAARGGNESQNYIYSGGDNPDDCAWFGTTSDSGVSHQVKTKNPNELGLYDMSGNVWEWCSDRYGRYSSDSQTNPNGASKGANRVLRGGCWGSDRDGIKITRRHNKDRKKHYSRFGLRLVLSAEW